MDRKLTIYFTSDIHGYFAPTDYASNCRADAGLANCAANYTDDGNTLILDGGDTLQGSPFTYWLYSRTEEKSLIPARLMTLAGYSDITLGNHDFNYGIAELERFLGELEDLECASGVMCLCANVEGLRHNARYAIHHLGNGLTVGVCGVTSQFIPNWEKPENIEGLTFTDAFETARDVLAEMKAQKVADAAAAKAQKAAEKEAKAKEKAQKKKEAAEKKKQKEAEKREKLRKNAEKAQKSAEKAQKKYAELAEKSAKDPSDSKLALKAAKAKVAAEKAAEKATKAAKKVK